MRAFAAISAFALMVTAAAAEKLPADAKALKATELRNIFIGNSMVWSTSRAYFSPDTKTKGLFGNPVSHTYSGTWSVSGNTVCMNNKSIDVKTGKSDGKTYRDCWKFYKSGKRTLSLWLNNYDKQLTENDYWDGELKSLKKGDQVSKQYAKYVR